jgi:4-amino-4-deoxy-L-arabinose transferase-like glycosyltransferase
MTSTLKNLINDKPWLILLALFVCAYCLNLFIPRELWVQDEMRYGEVVREMLHTGNWLVPHLNGAPYPDKPALYFWLVSALSMLVGEGELAFRLISTVATLLAGIGVYQVGNKLAGRNCGFWAALIFGSSLLTLIIGQIVRMDMLLTAITAFSWLALLRFDAEAEKSDLITFWILCALSLAIKGPIALLFTLLPSLLWIFYKRGFTGLSQLRPIFGLIAIISMVAAWILAVFQSGQGAYLSTIWHEQLVGRTINSWSHKEPLYFYVMLLPLLVMPWVGPILSGLWQTFKQRHIDTASILIFALAPLVGISLVSGKLFIYLEPLVPALCVAGALAIQKAESKASAWFTWPPVIYLLAVAGLVYYLSLNDLADSAQAALIIAAGLVVLAIVSAIASQFKLKTWLYSTAIISVIFSWLIFGSMTSLLNPLFSAKALAQTVSQYAGQDKPVAVINTTRGILNYYANRTFTELDKASAQSWTSAHPDALIIIKTKDIASAFPDSNVIDSCQLNKTFNVELKEYHVLAECRFKR